MGRGVVDVHNGEVGRGKVDAGLGGRAMLQMVDVHTCSAVLGTVGPFDGDPFSVG